MCSLIHAVVQWLLSQEVTWRIVMLWTMGALTRVWPTLHVASTLETPSLPSQQAVHAQVVSNSNG
jgi:hypothetical protein